MRILITGAGGTVGSAFIDLLNTGHDIIALDHNETNVARLRVEYPDIRVVTGDFADFMFEGRGIDLVIHLAALKHIDLCEESPASCVLENVIKTYNLFRDAKRHGAVILFMSTDKAVEPTSAYGYSKALGEKLAIEFGGAFARSGNVVASNGSVFKVWEDAISSLKPIRVTDLLMRRFFISPENLVKRIWSKYTAGERVIIPEMDSDRFLGEILSEKLNQAGYTIQTYPGTIQIIGLRPGEKMVEKLQ